MASAPALFHDVEQRFMKLSEALEAATAAPATSAGGATARYLHQTEMCLCWVRKVLPEASNMICGGP